MVAIKAIRESNARIANLPEGLVAVFIGATSGIGQNAVEQLAKYAVRPRIYIVARRKAATAELVARLRTSNPEGTYTVLEHDVSLVREVGAVVADVRAAGETRLDLLCLSVGFLPFGGRQDTDEGLDASMSTRYYARLRAVQLFLPLLLASPHPHVLSILAGGQESALKEDDLPLKKPGNYSLMTSSVHSATMGTVLLDRLARENPRVSFVHSFPGLVNTPVLSRTATGLLGFVLRWMVVPLIGLFGRRLEDAGASALYCLTSDRFAVASGGVPLSAGVEKATPTAGGMFLAGQYCESVDNEKLLADLRKRGVDELVWKHTMEVFDHCAAIAAAKTGGPSAA